MSGFRTKFTKWYYNKGYRMSYEPCDYADGVSELVFDCPRLVKILAKCFFSPTIYYVEMRKNDKIFEAIDDAIVEQYDLDASPISFADISFEDVDDESVRLENT